MTIIMMFCFVFIYNITGILEENIQQNILTCILCTCLDNMKISRCAMIINETTYQPELYRNLLHLIKRKKRPG